MANLDVTHAIRKDMAALNQLMYQLHEEHHKAVPHFFKAADDIMRDKNIQTYFDEPDGLVFCVKEGQNVIGLVTGHFSELVSTISKPIFMGSIDELYVLPNYRGRGIGKALVERIEREYRDYGVKHMYVEVWAFNETAQELYTHSGFQSHIHCLQKTLYAE